MTDIVVGNEAAQTPSRFSVLSSIPLATSKGGAHYKIESESLRNREGDGS